MNQADTVLVTGKDGLRGHVVSSARSEQDGQDGERQVLVEFENGRQVLVPTDTLVLQEDGSFYLPLSLQEMERQYQSGQEQQLASKDGALVIPIVAEQLDVQKRQVDSGGVRVRKIVREHEETVDQPLLREEVNVERVPVNQVAAPNSNVGVRYEGDTMIVPILEEVLVVEKRLLVKEELRITKRQTNISQPQKVMLRSEEAIVEPINPQQPRVNDSNYATFGNETSRQAETDQDFRNL